MNQDNKNLFLITSKFVKMPESIEEIKNWYSNWVGKTKTEKFEVVGGGGGGKIFKQISKTIKENTANGINEENTSKNLCSKFEIVDLFI